MSENNDLFIVTGCSMNPLLHTGDRIEGRAVQRCELKRGDIIIFVNAQEKKIIHRVICLHPLQTKGDNCARADAPVPEQSPLYRAIAYRCNGRTLPLTCGNVGLWEHRKHQFFRKARRCMIAMLSPLLALNPFRISFKHLTKCEFKTKSIYYAKNRPVGWIDEDGWHWMRRARYFVIPPTIDELRQDSHYHPEEV